MHATEKLGEDGDVQKAYADEEGVHFQEQQIF